ncbi:MAG: hypothetical protein HOH95_14295 [Dehalococcoidia bacterium]|jgi:hypothetical protein|nr:hypothetical protein [Dehalococcoidia bacterium]
MSSDRRDGGPETKPVTDVPTWTVGSVVLRLDEPRLFLIKALSVLVLSYALLPILAVKSSVPAYFYVSLMIVIHILVLAIYVYRVRFRELDASYRSLIARLIALAVVTYLLVVVSRFEDDASWAMLAFQMLGVTVFHAILLALIMFRLERRE